MVYSTQLNYFFTNFLTFTKSSEITVSSIDQSLIGCIESQQSLELKFKSSRHLDISTGSMTSNYLESYFFTNFFVVTKSSETSRRTYTPLP